MQSIFKNKKTASKYIKPVKSATYQEKFKSYLVGLVNLGKSTTQIEAFARKPSAESIGETPSPFLRQYFDEFTTKLNIDERMTVLKDLKDSGVV